MIFIDFAMSSRKENGQLEVHSYKAVPVKNASEDFNDAMILVSY